MSVCSWFLEGLLGDEQRKTGWMRAEAAGDPGPWRQQAILGRRDWDADALCDIVRDYVIEHLADDDAVLVIDETGFLKQGKASCGVARQYTGSAGKITNCQIGVFASYVSRHGHAFIDRALYLPKEWTDDPDRLEAVYLPPDVGFATKPKLATRMIARAIAASVPFRWVAGDTVYGVGDIEQQLRRAGKGYVLGVSSAHVFRSWGKRPPVTGTAADIARTRPPSDWKRLLAGAGTKGPRLHDWCYLELADLEAEASNDTNESLWTRGLLVRRHITDGDLAFFTTWCPAGTSLETLVAVEGHRWAIEDSFETAKNEFGLDHNESGPGMAGTVMCPW
jgi:SRSO17 transposase